VFRYLLKPFDSRYKKYNKMRIIKIKSRIPEWSAVTKSAMAVFTRRPVAEKLKMPSVAFLQS